MIDKIKNVGDLKKYIEYLDDSTKIAVLSDDGSGYTCDWKDYCYVNLITNVLAVGGSKSDVRLKPGTALEDIVKYLQK